MTQQHFYKHLDKDKNCNINIELNMEQLAQIINDLGREHVIAGTDNEYKCFSEDDFFKSRFEFV